MNVHRGRWGWMVLSALAASSAPNARAALDESAEVDAMLENVDSLWFGERTYAEVSMHIVTVHYTRDLKIHCWGEGKKKSLIRIVEPIREKGVSTLKVDDDVYNYMPKVARTIKLSQALLSQSWMGSHFLNSDLVRATHLRDNYIAHLLEKRHPSGGVEHWLIEAIAKDLVVTPFKRVVIDIERKSRLPVTQEYYDSEKRLSRIIKYDQVRDLGGRLTPSVMRLTPLDDAHKGEFTELTYDKINREGVWDKNLFDLTNLAHW